MKIKDCAPQERPRERLKKYGPRTLSSAELFALVLRQGTRKTSVLDIAHTLLAKHGLQTLSTISLEELIKIEGVGEVKALQIIACGELARRLAVPHASEKQITIQNVHDVVARMRPTLSTLKREEVHALYLNARKQLITQETIFIGSLDASIIHPREIFEPAIRKGAAGVIVIHNHPSGDPTPSKEDVAVTEQLINAGVALDIPLLDHIIIGKNEYFSFQEENALINT